ncbi:MAG: alpha-galactosidase, partial [Bacteroidaceae bacterium]|nr:alpha-galactosidase [Bacteroidaceae bacterium]
MKRNLLFLLLFVAVAGSVCHAQRRVSGCGWRLACDTSGVSIERDGETLMRCVRAEFAWEGRVVNSADYARQTFQKEKLRDAFGRCVRWTIRYSAPDLPLLTQTFRLYDDYLLIDASVSADHVLSVSSVAPIARSETGELLRSEGHRTLFVPYDNDAWIRYHSTRQTGSHFRSYEATAIYTPRTRQGVVIGALNHDCWKNVIDLTCESACLQARSGVADSLTRDQLQHGAVCGTCVTSSTFMLGVYDDWREGMDTYARLNRVVAPPRQWDKAMPVGWNSWGALQFRVNHANSTAVSRFIADTLQT